MKKLFRNVREEILLATGLEKTIEKIKISRDKLTYCTVYNILYIEHTVYNIGYCIYKK